jgi:predicted acetyltransferase
MAATSTLEIRSPTADELERYLRAVETAFLEQPHEDDISRWQRHLEPTHQYWALDGGVPVGTAGTYDHRMRIPGADISIAGVTLVGVHASHRRRGILRELMRRQLDDAQARGEALAVLWASEAAIYGRFGYGVASTSIRIDADRDRIVFREPDEPAGRARLVDEDEAKAVIPGVYTRARVERAGMIDRTDAWWDDYRLADPERWRFGAGPMFRAVWEDDDGEPQAYALYRLRSNWDEGFPAGKLEVREAIGASPQAMREIWRFLFGVDLVARVRGYLLPVDHPLFLSVTDPRRLKAQMGDGIWLRLLDLEAALEARSYAQDGTVAFDVRDAFCSWNDGTWRLTADGGRGAVERGGEADIRLDVADLASIYLGGFELAALRLTGRVEELTPGAIARTDAMFRTAARPWCPEIF